MNRFSAFIRKEFRHILRDRRTLLILFGMPVVQVLLFGFVLTNEIKDASIAILDPAKDEASTALTNKLLSSGYFRLERNLSSAEQLEPAFRAGKIKMALVFPDGFAQRLAEPASPKPAATLQLIGDASDPNTATTLIQYASAIIADFQRSRSPAMQAAGLQVETRMRYNPEQKGVFNFVPGVMTLILMLVAAMMTSITIAKEKEMGTMEILLVSPLKPIQIILGKTAPYLLLTLINAVVIVLMGIFVFGMPMRGSVPLLAASCVLYMFVALSLGIFISTRAKDQMTAMFMSALGLMMPTVLLSGFIFPRESMPMPLQVIGNIIPATHFNPVVKGIMIKGVGLEALWRQVSILGLMAIVFVALSLRNFKDRLE
ncbi:MAG TPA: ABC transporter permease [Saprospiraceae bacterium]|nr:ABC transporter permease [Saprospiraceae bacterium]HND87988.1 ABC transporter permease [Saprospiraceae bacterium]HNG90219.1 ABC transporter permease [Saprospiraceae bacterium]